MFAWVGFETLAVPAIIPANRAEGETKWSFRKLMRYGIGGVLFTTFPLKIAAVAGLLATLAGLVPLVEVIVEQFINPAMPSGYPTLCACSF